MYGRRDTEGGSSGKKRSAGSGQKKEEEEEEEKRGQRDEEDDNDDNDGDGEDYLDFIEPLIGTYGEDILEVIPKEFTSFVIFLCTGFDLTPHLRDSVETIVHKLLTSPQTFSFKKGGYERDQLLSPESFFNLFVDHARELRLILEIILRIEGHIRSKKLSHALIELTLNDWLLKKTELISIKQQLQPIEERKKNKEAGDATSSSKSVEDEREDYHRLLRAEQSLEERFLALTNRVYFLLDTPTVDYDIPHVMVLLQAHGFDDDAMLNLINKQRDPELLIERHIVLKNFSEMRSLLHAFGSAHPDLYVKVILYLVSEATEYYARKEQAQKGTSSSSSSSSQGGKREDALLLWSSSSTDLVRHRESSSSSSAGEDDDDDDDEEDSEEEEGFGGRNSNNRVYRHQQSSGDDSTTNEDGEEYDDEEIEEIWDNLIEVLTLVEREGTVPILHVLSLLMSSPCIPLSVVKPFMEKEFRLSRERLANLDSDIQTLRTNNEHVERGLATVRSTPMPIQIGEEQGEGGGRRRPIMDTPYVYFRCGHSFPAYDISEIDPECSKCAQEVRKWKKIQESQREQISKHEEFFKELEHNRDGFAVVAKAFGKPLT